MVPERLLVITVVASVFAALVPGCATTDLASPRAAPGAQVVGAPEAAWQAQWEETVAAAKREGRVVISGNNIESQRLAALEFQKTYPDITVEYIGLEWAPFEARVRAEREAGQYLWDLKMGGMGTSFHLGDEGWFEPIKPALLLPDVLDDSRWLGGFDASFGDPDTKRHFAFVTTTSQYLWVNRSLVSESRLSSPSGLLSAEWKGRIAMRDPRLPGPGANQISLLRKEFGDDFARKLVTEQEPVIVDDMNQIAEWLVRGRYPIGITAKAFFTRFREQGLGKDVEWLRGNLSLLGAEGQAIVFMDRAPHPNASKVFLNWLLSREGQSQWTSKVGTNSRRLDVAPGDPDSRPDPALLSQYISFESRKDAEFTGATREWARQVIR